MSVAQLTSLLAPTAFASLVAALRLIGAISVPEAVCYASSSMVAFVATGLITPGGWKRRAAEATLVPVALVLALVADPATRQMTIAPLLVLASIGATAAAGRRASRCQAVLLAGALAISIRVASGLALLDMSPLQALFPFVTAALLAAGVAHVFGLYAALLAAALVGTLPLCNLHPGLQVLGIAAGLAVLRLPVDRYNLKGCVGWFPGVLPVVLVVSMSSPWGPDAIRYLGFPILAGVGVTVCLLVASWWWPPGAAGAGWLAASLLLGSTLPVGPAAGPTLLDASVPEVTLPAGDGGTYTVEVTLANASGLSQGTPVAEVIIGTTRVPIRAGVETAEWAHERDDVRASVKHSLPAHPIWRPSGFMLGTGWAVAGRITLDVPAGTAPVIRPSRLLPESSRLIVTANAGGRAAGRRDPGTSAWILAAACLVAVLQVAGASLGGPTSWLPWVLLETGLLAARSPIEPLATLGQACTVELCLGAVLAAWLAASRQWLSTRRFFLTAATLLVPLAVATPHLSPPLGDDTYHLLLMESITRDGDLDVANNIDTGRYPNQAIYKPFDRTFIHSPVLAVLLAPGYYLAGRSGAAVPLALAGAALLALAMRRALQLGVPNSKVSLLSVLLLLSYPLATFSTQLWTEIPGALLALACAVPLAAPKAHRLIAAAFTLLATLLKTRLALVTLPPATVAWIGRSRGVRTLWGLGFAGVIAVTGWVLAVGVVGNPLDPMGRRHFGDLVPNSLSQPLLVLGGLAFDAAGGLAFSAPLLLVSMLGLRGLWRRGGAGERALVLGGVLTVIALLHVVEWRGGDSPPARYLVPLWGCLALAAALLVAGSPPWRRLLDLLVPPTVTAWWIGVTRPEWLVNVGDGGFWLGDILSSRLGVDALDLFPSFLRPSPARWVVPGTLVMVALVAVAAAIRRPSIGRLVGRASVALWLLAGAFSLVVMGLKTDRVVEIEDPQVLRFGGTAEPPVGTFSRFLQPNGVRLKDADRLSVPVRLPSDPEITLEGWLDDEARDGVTLWLCWSGGRERPVHVAGEGRGVATITLEQAAGKGTLGIRLEAARGGTAVLDRLVIRAQ